MSTTAKEVLAELKKFAKPANVKGMVRFGINPANTLGVSIPTLRGIAKSHRLDHALALELWESGIHEARILAAFVDDPKQVTESQMEVWVKDFDSWDVCDQVCSGLFDKIPWADQKAVQWSKRPEEFVKRAGLTFYAWRIIVSAPSIRETSTHYDDDEPAHNAPASARRVDWMPWLAARDWRGTGRPPDHSRQRKRILPLG